MKTRKSGLGGIFAVLTDGTRIRLGECSRCHRFILIEGILYGGEKRRYVLQELQNNDVDISLDYGGREEELYCKICMDKISEHWGML